MTFTAEETADMFPVGRTVVFRGYNDKEVRGWLRVGQTLTVVGHNTFPFWPSRSKPLKEVGHNTFPGPDGLLVKSAQGDEHFVFATEVGFACTACDGPEPDGHLYCESCSVFQCMCCGELDVTTAEVDCGDWMCASCAESEGCTFVELD